MYVPVEIYSVKKEGRNIKYHPTTGNYFKYGQYLDYKLSIKTSLQPKKINFILILIKVVSRITNSCFCHVIRNMSQNDIYMTYMHARIQYQKNRYIYDVFYFKISIESEIRSVLISRYLEMFKSQKAKVTVRKGAFDFNS